MINLETLEGWLNAPVENERLEFKEAKNQGSSRLVMTI
jgi:ATP-dependent DNA helicase RecG